MHRIASTGLKFSIIFYTVIHFYTYFSPSRVGHIGLVISGFFLLLFTVLKRPVLQIKMPLGLVLVGLLIMIYQGNSIITELENGLLLMRNMIGLLIVVPMISWVLHEERYIESFMGYAHKFLNTSRKFYFGIISFTQIIAYFLLFGSITMMYQFVSYILKNEKGEAWENFKSTPLLRGFGLSVMWVVSIPSFAYVVEIMGASLGISIIQGLLISFAGIILAIGFSYFEEKHYSISFTSGLEKEIEDVLAHTEDISKMKHNVWEFLLLFITLFGSIFVIQALVSIELLVLIPLTVLVWIMVYYLYKRRPEKLLANAKTFYQKGMEHQAYQLCVMLGAGLLIYSLNQTNFAQTIVDSIYSLQRVFPFLNLLYLLPFIVILLGFVGLGPLTVMVLVGGILETIKLPYPPELVVLAITSGSAISIMLSPLIMPVIALSSVNGLNPFKNGIHFNWKYTIAFYILVQLYIQVRVFFGV
ncbi:hypothetical protein F9U64_17575 [Gracilibacillus oryzae]|uniref:TRAP C4-dicarboxylate transport system permease DctM subunit domain-containing protein n=1 Tax=Gracilibacillus oryzae TaxID=1672701 RepID=A0A7C8GRJ2_9BACI|nr:hypothetical protein [Gracilibacillus oryzae]KAB8127457.1 hypothetical protein F9U64_17575 [Gracilibacillus oryzae]